MTAPLCAVPDILDRIDAMTAPVCGWCQTPLDPDGPSLDFCDLDPHKPHEAQCQTLWHAHRSEKLTGYREAGHQFFGDAARFGDGQGEVTGFYAEGLASRVTPMSLWPSGPPVIVFPDLANVQRAANDAIAAMDEALRDASAALAPFARRCFGQLEQPDPPSVPDVMAAALEARQNRNTGPQHNHRAPKRMDRAGRR